RAVSIPRLASRMIPPSMAKGTPGSPLRPYPVEATGIARRPAWRSRDETPFRYLSALTLLLVRTAASLHRYGPFVARGKESRSNVDSGQHRSPPDSPHPRGTSNRSLDLLGHRRRDLRPWLGRPELEDGRVLLHRRGHRHRAHRSAAGLHRLPLYLRLTGV